MPSHSLNEHYKKTLEDYKNKLGMAMQTDNNIKSRYEEHKGQMQILQSSKQQLSNEMPRV